MSLIFEEFGLDPKKFIFVTDRGSNIISALDGFTRLSCAAHLINNVLSSAADETDVFTALCKKSKLLVKYLKKSSNLQQKLLTSLKAECNTRWNTKLHMFKSIAKNWNEIVPILNSRNELARIDGIQIIQIEEVVPFLTGFEIGSIYRTKRPLSSSASTGG